MFRYVKKTVKYVLIALCVSIFVLLIMPVLYLFELFHPFRFGRVMNSRIGEMGPGLDQFLRKKKLGLLPANTTYFFALYDKTANHQMARMFKRTDLNIITNWLYTRFYEFCTPVLTRTRFYVMTAGNFFRKASGNLRIQFCQRECFQKNTPRTFFDFQIEIGIAAQIAIIILLDSQEFQVVLWCLSERENWQADNCETENDEYKPPSFHE